MTLHAEVRIGQRTTVGRIEISRTTNLDAVVLRPNVVSTYRVRVDDRDVGRIAHRYGDDPWALLAAAAAIVPRPASPAVTAERGA